MMSVAPTFQDSPHTSNSARDTRPVGRRRVATILGALTLTAFVGVSSAVALPKVGAARQSVHLVDGWDRDVNLASFKRPVLIVYEDKDSASQNQALKDDLADLQKSSNYRKGVAHIIVADTSSYDYWPAKGIAKGELRKWSNKLGIVVYSDFSADVRTRLQLEKGLSNVVLYDAQGNVLFAHAGTVPPEERKHLIELIKEQL